MKIKKSSETVTRQRTRKAEQGGESLSWTQFWEQVTAGTKQRSDVRDQAQFIALSAAQNQLLR